MTTLRERVTTTLPPDEAFAFVADFANAASWDPGTASSVRMGDGPVDVGARYRLGVRVAGRVVPMDYEVTAFDPAKRVVLRGTGRGIRATDEIRFAPLPNGTEIDYTADIRLVGLLRPLGWFAAGALQGVGRAAKEGMERALLARAQGA
jgi:carbon monoxide dehydrogenase subunit G